MSIYDLLKTIIKIIEKLMDGFICGFLGGGGRQISRQVVCRPIFEGKLRIRTMKDQMKVLKIKLAWIISVEASTQSQT